MHGPVNTGDLHAQINNLKSAGRKTALLLVADGDGATRSLTVNIQ
jgi:hypothetical protein